MESEFGEKNLMKSQFGEEYGGWRIEHICYSKKPLQMKYFDSIVVEIRFVKNDKNL